MAIDVTKPTVRVGGFTGLPDGTDMNMSVLDKLTGTHRWGRLHWGFKCDAIRYPEFWIKLRLVRNYFFIFYFRYRPSTYRKRTGDTPFVIDWPTIKKDKWRE